MDREDDGDDDGCQFCFMDPTKAEWMRINKKGQGEKEEKIILISYKMAL